MIRLADLAWPDVPEHSLLVVPIGSCEQHGPHLPLDTDTRIAVALAETLGSRRDDCVIAPAVTLGASGEHESFPGTLSIGALATETLVVELVRSALPPTGSPRPAPFDAVVVVNGHGGNIEALGRAGALLADEGRRVLMWHPRVPDGDSHAGHTETSMMLHLDPSVVRMELAVRGSTSRWREIGPVVMTEGLAAVTVTGILGDPTTATADAGRVVFDTLAERLAADVAGLRGTLDR